MTIVSIVVITSTCAAEQLAFADDSRDLGGDAFFPSTVAGTDHGEDRR